MNKIIFGFIGLCLTFVGCKSAESLREDITLDAIVVTPEIPRASADRIFDLIHTHLELRPIWEKQELLGTARLTLTPVAYPQQLLELDARNFDIHAMHRIEGVRSWEMLYSHHGDKLIIELGEKVHPGDTIEIEIGYTAKPYARESSNSGPIAGDRGLYFINPTGTHPGLPKQLWTQGETHGSRGWFPTIDQPNQNTTQTLFVTIPENMVSLSNGVLYESESHRDGTKTDRWRQDIPHAPYLFALAVGEFAIIRDRWNSIEVPYYVEPAYTAHARAIYGKTPEMLEFFSDLFGYKYPWAKYGQIAVRHFVAGAMENTTATIHHEGLHKTADELIDNDEEGIITHELAHQWFGDIVTCESWSHLPLNESFATYATYLWREHAYGRDVAEAYRHSMLLRYFREARERQVPLIRFAYSKDLDMFDRHSYQKGAATLHVLRDLLGDEVFFASLKKYLHDNAFQPVEVEHLRLAMEEVSGLDLKWFFDQWFHRSGHPVIEQRYGEEDGMGFISLTLKPDADDQQGDFRLRMNVHAWFDETEVQRELHDLTLSAGRVDTLWFSKTPIWVDIDGSDAYLGELKEPGKPMSAWIFQAKHGGVLDRLAAVRGLSGGGGDGMEQLKAMLHDPAPVVRRAALATLDGTHLRASLPVIQKMVRSDADANVRKDALVIASKKLDVDQLLPLCRDANKDKSAMVRAQSLVILAKHSKDEGILVASAWEPDISGPVRAAVAGVYARAALNGKMDFVIEAFRTIYGRRKASMLQHVATFIAGSVDRNEIEKGLRFLHFEAMNYPHPTYAKAACSSLEVAVKALRKRQEDALVNLTNDEMLELGEQLLAECQP